MSRFAIALLCLCGSVGVLQAAEPGLLTFSDIQADVPGVKVEPFLGNQGASFCSPQPPSNEVVADLRCLRWGPSPATDADGSIYFTTTDVGISVPPKLSALWRTRRNGTTERVVHVEPRQLPSGAWATGFFLGFVIDPPRGYLYAQFRSTCVPLSGGDPCQGTGTLEIVRISGLPTFNAGRGSGGD